jgi:superfamily I DNA and RNA helicase
MGPFIITRTKKTKTGLTIYPWQALTEDRVTPELRQIIAKVVRSEAKNYLQWLTEQAQEDRRLIDFITQEMDRQTRQHYVVDKATVDKAINLTDHLRSLERYP